MNKKILFGMLGLFAIGLVAAGYIVNSFVITTDVYEPFKVEYAIIGDAGNWDGVTTCTTYSGAWMTVDDDENIDVGGLYAGEGRVVCTKITNIGEGDVDYTFSGEVVSGNGNLAECTDAFGNPSTSGVALGSSVTKDGVIVLVADDAVPVDDCEITLTVSRG